MKQQDCEPIDKWDNDTYEDIDNRDDFPSMFMQLFGHINFKLAAFIFLMGLFIFSDVFVKNILAGFPDAVNLMNFPTTYGTIIQLLFLVIAYLILDLLVQGKYI